jgi:hypothetical protein
MQRGLYGAQQAWMWWARRIYIHEGQVKSFIRFPFNSFVVAFREWCCETTEGAGFWQRYLDLIFTYRFDPMLFSQSLADVLCLPGTQLVDMTRWIRFVGYDKTPQEALNVLTNEVMLRGPLCV